MSNGITGRKIDDVFVNSENEKMLFKTIKFYPSNGGCYTDAQMTESLSQCTTNIIWENKRTKGLKSYCIISFEDNRGDTIYHGRYLTSVKIPISDNYISNSLSTGYKFGGASAIKTRAGLTPQDILTDSTLINSHQILSDIKAMFGEHHVLYDTAKKIESGLPFPIAITAPIDVSYTAFRDYYCELLHPIAIQRGNFTGNGNEAAIKFLGATSFANTLITFDNSKNAGLSDSKLTSVDGRIVKISSKGGGGAEASVKNIAQCISEMQHTPIGASILSNYSDSISLIRDIQNSGQSSSPLMLGIKFGLIDSSDAAMISSLKDKPHINLEECGGIVSKKLHALSKSRSAKNPHSASLYYHLLAALAHEVAHIVNTTTNFSQAASAILNNSALIQVYTVSKDRGTTWILEGFDTVHPGDNVKGVVLSAVKNYSSTGIKGNFTFKILKK